MKQKVLSCIVQMNVISATCSFAATDGATNRHPRPKDFYVVGVCQDWSTKDTSLQLWWERRDAQVGGGGKREEGLMCDWKCDKDAHGRKDLSRQRSKTSQLRVDATCQKWWEPGGSQTIQPNHQQLNVRPSGATNTNSSNPFIHKKSMLLAS